jgi:hypothetical protein
MSHLQAEVRTAGRSETGHVTTAAFGESRPGFDFTYRTAPEVGPPDDYPGLATPPPGVAAWRSSFFDNLDVRRVRSFASFETDWEGGRAEVIRWFRYKTPPRPTGASTRCRWWRSPTMPPAIAQHRSGFASTRRRPHDAALRRRRTRGVGHVVGHWRAAGTLRPTCRSGIRRSSARERRPDDADPFPEQ